MHSNEVSPQSHLQQPGLTSSAFPHKRDSSVCQSPSLSSTGLTELRVHLVPRSPELDTIKSPQFQGDWMPFPPAGSQSPCLEVWAEGQRGRRLEMWLCLLNTSPSPAAITISLGPSAHPSHVFVWAITGDGSNSQTGRESSWTGPSVDTGRGERSLYE